MNVIDQLASSLGRRDEEPNKELAATLIKSGDKKDIKELVANLQHKKKDIQNDCIKVLYEIAEQKPKLIALYAPDFIALLNSNNNRMVWGAMTALSAIALEAPSVLYSAMPKIMDAANGDSIIARDHAVKILTHLGSLKEYKDDAIELLLELLTDSPENQFPTYAENMAPLITVDYKARFIKILNDKLPDIASDTKRKRVDKLLKKIG